MILLPAMPRMRSEARARSRSGVLRSMPALPSMPGQRGHSDGPVMHSPGYEIMDNGDVTGHCSSCGNRVEAIRLRQGNDHWDRNGQWLIGKHYCNECKPRQFGKVNGVRQG